MQQAACQHNLRGRELRHALQTVLRNPTSRRDDPTWGRLARCLEESHSEPPVSSIKYACWGAEIDQGAHDQMATACQLPSARGAALMPDAHIGYGLPIGGVLACQGAVIPYAVGVDIACRMKLSVLDLAPPTLEKGFDRYRHALEKGTRFGVGSQHERPQQHAVMDRDWSITRVTREKKDRAWKQLGTSGSGNHFVEFGVLSIDQQAADLELAPGQYVALLSHSGSRGAGAAVCDTYSRIARAQLPKRYASLGRLAWLSMESETGQEYWQAMNLMGEYAAANHAVIHRLVTKLLGARVIAGVENHHNFAWQEEHQGEQLIVHRKGATPAGEGVLGVIPGSMRDPAYIVRGKGHPQSYASAAHGAGRRMSRTKAKSLYNFRAVQRDLAQQGIRVLAAGADEVPGVYKDIDQVMREQSELVTTVARFDPKIVKMCGDGSKAED